MARYTYFVATFAILPVMVILGVVALFVFRSPQPEPTDAEGLDKDFELYKEVRQKLLDHYDGELTEDQLRDAALIGLAQGTGDQFTRVLPPVQAQEQSRSLKGGFYGIGAYISGNPDGSIQLTGLQPDGGAERAGLLVNDVIVAVDGISILEQSFESSVARVKSDTENSVVKLTVHRGGDPKRGDDPKAMTFDFDVTRSRVITYSVHDVHIEERGDRRFGYMYVSDINENTYAEQLVPAVNDLSAKGAEGLILDMRSNGGGRVNAAADIVDGFLTSQGALIVFTHSSRESNREKDHTYRTKDALAITDLPLVLLVDANTASAAEIITGALKDHGRAFVIGTRTYGKGLVQTIFKLNTDPNYSVNITTTQYYSPLGRKVNRGANGEPGGIQPDLEIQYRNGERDGVYRRLSIRQARNNREEIAKSSSYWDYEDRMLSAALDLLAGKPVTVGP
jgi:carboxyl-terminal processing protease